MDQLLQPFESILVLLGLFHVVLESLNRCIVAIFNAGESSTHSFLRYKALRIVISFLVLWSIY